MTRAGVRKPMPAASESERQVRAREALSLALETEAGGPALDAPYEERRGWCYALALRAFVEAPFEPGAKLTLVHGFPRLAQGFPPLADGFPRLQTTGAMYGHAWVEVEITTTIPAALAAKGWPAQVITVLCHDPITDGLLPQALYHRAGRIRPEHCERWSTPLDALGALTAHGTIGNWADEDNLPERPIYAAE